ncbi:hypothetical protein CHCC20335_2458 [Bacillus paralicheniformis]|nr:hypothetical protein CHCC20335_2458 [Bacillus paralicheniformis]
MQNFKWYAGRRLNRDRKKAIKRLPYDMEDQYPYSESRSSFHDM